MQRWQILSFVLVFVLGISVGVGVYQNLNPSKASNGNPPNDQSDTLSNSTSTANNTWLNFTFTWGPESQNIVQGEFRIKIGMCFYTYSTAYATQKRIWMLIETNDDEYDDWDYIGLVFDTNQNGYVDIRDETYGAYANNMTQPASLYEDGFLAFAEMSPIRGPQHVTFASDKGYTFSFNFPSVGYESWDPLPSLKTGCNNPLHICFLDDDAGGVFMRFLFYIPEE